MVVPTVGIIMAGGTGERFWPVSRQKHPKQLLKLNNNQMTLLDEAINRLLPIIPAEQIFIATNQQLQDCIRAAAPRIPAENIIAEPARRNTLGCLAYVAAHLLAKHKRGTEDLVMAITTADHRIGDDEEFRRTIQAAVWYAKEHSTLMVVGIPPTRPETGYGYIELPLNEHPAAALHGVSIFPTRRFREKPSFSEAEEFLQTGRFYWNSGMFFWRLSLFLKELEDHVPEAMQCILEMRDAMLTSYSSDSRIASVFELLPNTSIDYALMEKTENVYMAIGDFPWDDVGLWDSLDRIQTKDVEGNVVIGDPILIDCNNVTVYNEPGAEKMAVGAIGLKNVIVVTTPDGVLVCSKDRAKDVRKIVEKLQARNDSHL